MNQRFRKPFANGKYKFKEEWHFDDQAEKLFSRARAKPTYFLNKAGLEKHVTPMRELIF